eukprot:1124627-Pelagomonas_calceolata.AAC.7
MAEGLQGCYLSTCVCVFKLPASHLLKHACTPASRLLQGDLDMEEAEGSQGECWIQGTTLEAGTGGARKIVCSLLCRSAWEAGL